MSLLTTESPAALLRDALRATGLFGVDAWDVEPRPVFTPALANRDAALSCDRWWVPAGVGRRPGR